MRFRGRLRAPGDTGPGLPVAVLLDDDGLTLESNGERIGSWSLSEVSATRTASDRFEMGFGDEQLLFEAEDTLGFSYEALPFIDGRRSRSGMLTKIRTVFAPTEPARSLIDLRDDRHLEVVPDEQHPEPSPDPSICRGTRRDGLPCRSTIVLDSGYCSSHDPNRPAPKPKTYPIENESLTSVFRHLERAISDVRAGRMDPETASALADLARAMCATIEADASISDITTPDHSYLRRAT